MEDSVGNENRNQEAEQKKQVQALGTARMLGLCRLSVEMVPYLCSLGTPGLTKEITRLPVKKTFLIIFAK